MSKDNKTPEKKQPRKNKQPPTWQDRAIQGGVGVGLATVLAAFGLDYTGDIDLDLRKERILRIKDQNWRVLKERNWGAIARLSTTDEEEIREALGIGKGTSKRIIPYDKVYENSPEIPILAKVAPSLTLTLSQAVKRRQNPPEDYDKNQGPDGATSEYYSRERLAEKILHNNLVEKAWKLYSESEEGKAFTEQLARTPRDAAVDLLEAIENADMNALEPAGLVIRGRTKTIVDGDSTKEVKETTWMIGELKALPEDVDWSTIKNATIYKPIRDFSRNIAMDEFLRDFLGYIEDYQHHLFHPYYDDKRRLGDDNLKASIEKNEFSDVQKLALRSFGILDAIQKTKTQHWPWRR